MKPERLHPSQPTPASIMSYEDLSSYKAVMTGDGKHNLSSKSTLDLIWFLHDRVFKFVPQVPNESSRDGFLLTKG